MKRSAIERLAVTSEPRVEAQPSGQRWSCGLDAVSTTARCAQAPEDGTTIYITEVIVTNNGATNATAGITAGTGSACATGTVALLYSAPALGTLRLMVPEASGASGPPTNVFLSFRTPIRVPYAKDVCFGASQAVTVQLMGYLAP
jgi:hypothetical protein